MSRVRVFLRKQWAKQEVRVAVGVTIASLVGATLGIRWGYQHGTLADLGLPGAPTYPTEALWTATTTTAPTTLRRSGQVSGATATSTSTNPGGTGTTTQGHRSRAGSTTTSILTGGVPSTRDAPTTTTQSTDPPTSFPRPTQTTATVPEPIGATQ